LQEIHATGGDVRRICDLFGLSITAELRYANTLEHPDLADGGAGTHRAREDGHPNRTVMVGTASPAGGCHGGWRIRPLASSGRGRPLSGPERSHP
jgi:hypothetical protein